MSMSRCIAEMVVNVNNNTDFTGKLDYKLNYHIYFMIFNFRLLAYNPYDPCRGIFSDWFRFPSCCICKCYDVPLDYRVTSRSPRSSKLLEATEDVPMTLFDDEDNRNSYGP